MTRWTVTPSLRSRRRRPCAPLLCQVRGAADDTTTTDPRSRRNRASRRGGQLLTRARSSSYASACSHLRAPGVSVPMVAPYAANRITAAGLRHQESYTGYQHHREHERHHPPGLPHCEGLAGCIHGPALDQRRHLGGGQGLPSPEGPSKSLNTRPRPHSLLDRRCRPSNFQQEPGHPLRRKSRLTLR
jgi:hypothetical protein